MEELEEVVIVGAGISGLAVAVALKRVGVQALVLERSEGLRATGTAISLLQNAWLALEALGVAHKLSSLYAAVNKGVVTNIRTGTVQEVSMVRNNSGGAGPKIVHRKALLEALAQELPNNTIRFSSKLNSIEVRKQEGSSIALLHMEDGTVIKTKILIGCDGLHSVVGRWLGLGAPVDSGRFAVRGLAVFPEGHEFKQEYRQFIDGGSRGAFVPINDKEVFWFYVTINFNYKDEDLAGNQEFIQRKVIENFVKDFPPIFLNVVNHSILSSLTWGPLMLRFPWDVIFGNVRKGTITVVGDAMHPMTPDLGQGGCSALEDAVVLGRHIGETVIRDGRLVPKEAANAIERYVKERRWHSAWLITGSFLVGWVQQAGSGWWMNFIKDVIFYRLLSHRVFDVSKYDCGKLPTISPSYGEHECPRKDE